MGGVNVYTRGSSGIQWGELEFVLEANDTGGVGITIAGVRSFGLYAGTIDAAQPDPTPIPTPAPAPTPDAGSGCHTDAAADGHRRCRNRRRLPPLPRKPQPQPTAVVSHAPEPTPTPQPAAVVIGKSLGMMPPAPSAGDYVPTAQPEAASNEGRLKRDLGRVHRDGHVGGLGFRSLRRDTVREQTAAGCPRP